MSLCCSSNRSAGCRLAPKCGSKVSASVQVTELSAFVVDDRQRPSRSACAPTLRLNPGVWGWVRMRRLRKRLTFLEDFVLRGLRARMITGNILSGRCRSSLCRSRALPTPWCAKPTMAMPIIPTTRSEITDVAATAEGVLDRINDRCPSKS